MAFLKKNEMLKDITFLAMILFTFWACEKSETSSLSYSKKNAKVYEKKVELVDKGEVYFPIDSSVSIDFGEIQYLETESKPYLTIFDPTTPILHVYDYENQKKINTIIFPLQGPAGVGGNTSGMGHLMYSLDTIIIYNIWTRNLFLFNTEGEKLVAIGLPEPDDIYFSGRLADSPPFRVGNYVVIPNTYQGVKGGMLIQSQEIPAFLTVNIDTQEISFIGKRSKVYDEGYNIAGDNSFNFGVFNSNDNSIVYSFRQDHHVYKTDIAGNNESMHFVGSEHFEELPALEADFNKGFEYENNGDERERVRQYILMNPKYDAIKYDRWNDLYYRFAFLPRNMEDYLESPYRLEPTIVIFDENFNKVGERKLDAKGYYSVAKINDSFVTNDGLLIPWRNPDKEDVLTFKVFKLEQ